MGKLIPIGNGTFQSIDEVSKITIIGNSAVVLLKDVSSYRVDELSERDKEQLKGNIMEIFYNG